MGGNVFAEARVRGQWLLGLLVRAPLFARLIHALTSLGFCIRCLCLLHATQTSPRAPRILPPPIRPLRPDIAVPPVPLLRGSRRPRKPPAHQRPHRDNSLPHHACGRRRERRCGSREVGVARNPCALLAAFVGRGAEREERRDDCCEKNVCVRPLTCVCHAIVNAIIIAFAGNQSSILVIRGLATGQFQARLGAMLSTASDCTAVLFFSSSVGPARVLCWRPPLRGSYSLLAWRYLLLFEDAAEAFCTLTRAIPTRTAHASGVVALIPCGHGAAGDGGRPARGRDGGRRLPASVRVLPRSLPALLLWCSGRHRCLPAGPA